MLLRCHAHTLQTRRSYDHVMILTCIIHVQLLEAHLHAHAHTCFLFEDLSRHCLFVNIVVYELIQNSKILQMFLFLALLRFISSHKFVGRMGKAQMKTIDHVLSNFQLCLQKKGLHRRYTNMQSGLQTKQNTLLVCITIHRVNCIKLMSLT